MNLINSLIATLSMVAALHLIGCQSKKPYRLAMLALTRNSGTPNIPIDCRLSYQMTQQIANNRTDFLPDYDIEIVFGDEKLLSAGAPNETLSFAQRFQTQHQEGPDLFPSPIIVGPWQSNGCKAIGAFLHQINYIAISTLCTATVVADRNRFPNLFLSIPTSNPKNYGFVRFFQDVGHWKRFALVVFADNINDFTAALHFEQVATQQGMDVPWFNSIVNFDLDTAVSLKDSGARIIVLMSSSPTANTINFYCYAYQVGMTGARYLFFTVDAGTPNPYVVASNLLPPGCTREILIEQVKYTLSMGTTDDNADLLQKTSFGYNRIEFDEMFTQMKNGSARGTDYDVRLVCHDSLMQAVHILDKVETVLKADNLSLRSFTAEPKKIIDIVNREACNVDLKGLRASSIRYNSRGELSGVPSFVVYWNKETSFQKMFVITKLDNMDIYDYQAYRVRQVGSMKWLTVDGKPPRDRRQSMKLTKQPPNEALIAIIIVACALALGQYSGAVATFVKRKANQLELTMPWFKCFGVTGGCLVMDAAAVTFVLQTSANGNIVLWNVRIVLLVISLSMIITNVSVRMAYLYLAAKRAVRAGTRTSISSSRTTAPSTSPLRGKATIDRSVFLKGDIICIRTVLAVASAVAIVLIIWLQIDPLSCYTIQPAPPFYNEADDVLYETYVVICYSANQVSWLIGLLVVHVLLLLVAGFFAFDLRQSKAGLSLPECTLSALAIVNISIFLLASILILLVIREPISQQIAVSVLALAISGSTSAIWLFASIKPTVPPGPPLPLATTRNSNIGTSTLGNAAAANNSEAQRAH